MQTHKALVVPPETHGHTPLHGHNNKLVPSAPTQTAKPRKYMHTQTHRYRHGASLLRPGHPRRPKDKKHRQGKLRIPRGNGFHSYPDLQLHCLPLPGLIHPWCLCLRVHLTHYLPRQGTVEQDDNQDMAFPHNHLANFTVMTWKIDCNPASKCRPLYLQS